jgi:hypothetical protein
MAESLESFKSYIGKKETATDVVTASAMLKFAATLGQENPPMDKGAPIPLGAARHRPQPCHDRDAEVCRVRIASRRNSPIARPSTFP